MGYRCYWWHLRHETIHEVGNHVANFPITKVDSSSRTYGLDKLGPFAQADLTANIVSVLQAGCLVGSLASYWFADKYGRRPALMVAAWWAIIGVVFQ
jgi:MFS family permease